MKPDVDIAVVGGGHNGLVCACYLAHAGLRVMVVERRAVVGGAAVTEEFHPGFRNSVAAYTVGLLNPKVIRDLRLKENGLRIVERRLANFWPMGRGRSLSLGTGPAADAREIARFSDHDADAYPAYRAALDRVADVLRASLLEAPPNAGGGWRDLLAAVRLGNRMRRLPLAVQRDLVDLFTKSAADFLGRWFENPMVMGALAFESIVGTYASPHSPGTAYVLLHHSFGEVNGKRGVWGHARGGMGAITEAMAREARRRGVEIACGAPVERILVEDGRVRGLRLADGRDISARAVAAAINPKLLYTRMIEAVHLEREFLDRMKRWKCASATFRMNVALDRLPQFADKPADGMADHHTAGIVIGPDLDYLDRAYEDARREGWSRAPVIEMLIPSTLDSGLAPPGKHVASLFCQHFAPELPGGRSWGEAREEAADHIIATVDRIAPGFADSVLGRSALSPLDLERDFGLLGGDIFHGAMSLDQLFSARPILGHADYRGPIAGLYHAGAGAHPGGGVTGAPGHNAAHQIARDFGRRLR